MCDEARPAETAPGPGYPTTIGGAGFPPRFDGASSYDAPAKALDREYAARSNQANTLSRDSIATTARKEFTLGRMQEERTMAARRVMQAAETHPGILELIQDLKTLGILR